MSTAILKLGGKEFDVLNCSFTFRRNLDSKGKAVGLIQGGSVSVTIASTADTSVLEAMIKTPDTTFDGSIEFKDGTTAAAKMKELEFKKAYITEFTEGLELVGPENMKQTFTISAELLKLGGAQHSNTWATT